MGDEPEAEGLPESVLIPFRHREAGGPKAIVIGGGHPPYYLFDDGHTEPASPGDPN
jgi:hypothetical protein